MVMKWLMLSDTPMLGVDDTCTVMLIPGEGIRAVDDMGIVAARVENAHVSLLTVTVGYCRWSVAVMISDPLPELSSLP